MALSIVALTAAYTNAQTPVLSMPVDCELGKDCFIFKYADTSPDKSVTDYVCGRRSTDGHKGTDFALTDPLAIDKNIPVLAMSDGVVLATRDGIKDNQPGKVSFPEGKDCGNRVGIEHGGAWLTDYCHLKQGSIKVRKGDKVNRGQVIGYVGSSGVSERPHLHVSVRQGKTDIDPFSGIPLSAEPSCDSAKSSMPRTTLWDDEAQDKLSDYRPQVIEYLGLATDIPDIDSVTQQQFTAKSATNPPLLVAYVTVLGTVGGIEKWLRIFSPDGSLFFEHTNIQKKNFARSFIYAGTKRPDSGFDTGLWTLVATVRGRGPIGPFSETRINHFEIR